MTEDSANHTILGHDVFVSYASQDAAVANSIVESLESRGVKCWIAPRDVKPGAQYADAIVRAINEAKAVVLVMSGNAVASSHVGKEVERASSKRKPIIAFRIDTAPLSHALEYFLSESQWIDIPALGMKAALAKLAEAVGQGSVTSTQATPPEKRGRMTTRRIAIAAAVVVALGVVAGSGFYFWKTTHGGAQAPSVAAITDKSIAVLPFVDMSEKKDQEYFADGMAEEIIDLLVTVPGLKVIGRTSSFQFKGRTEDLRSIGSKLNAAYILEGSVRKSGEQVRITAQLINAQSGIHEWSETYDRRIGDVLKLQSLIAASVARGLELTVDSLYRNQDINMKNVVAYDLILRGRRAIDRYDKEGFDEAVRLFQEALESDGTSSHAAAGLAWAYYDQGAYGIRPAPVAFEQARSAATLSLKLDPRNVFAHGALGSIHLAYDWDWAAADAEYQQVATLAPGSADAMNNKAWLSLALGRWDDAVRQTKAALAQDPFCPNCYESLMWAQMSQGHLAEAEAAMRRGLEIHPTYSWGHFYLGLVLLERGDREAALIEMRQETVEQAQQAGLAMAYYALGRIADSDAALATMLKEEAAVSAFDIANVYAFRGLPEKAMEWLQRAYIQKAIDLYLIKAFPPLKTLATDPRYKAFLKKMNLPSD
jgi:TolB-like protein/Tfp pilus assembly protein PilF